MPQTTCTSLNSPNLIEGLILIEVCIGFVPNAFSKSVFYLDGKQSVLVMSLHCSSWYNIFYMLMVVNV